ncbi:MAG: DegT/DnrJ/EryC1/StrS family aminotransferase [Patescibacteria group bacterium]|nr:DegT/DnrJ/EryC1/StrS family aminotransferase [Patescibacteria group bacterium]
MNQYVYRRKIAKLTKQLFRNRPEEYAIPNNKVTIGWPAYDEKEILSVLDSILDLRISQGPKVLEFEKMLAEYIGRRYAVAVNSGSSANLLALATLLEAKKIKPGDEVIVPATTFSAVAAPILHLGLIPVYVDVEKKSWNIDPLEIKKAIAKKTRAIMVVHSFGNPADMQKITAIAKRHKLIVIEDCCEAHGAMIGKRKVGSFGELATMSFYVAHNITTGEGGAVFTNNRQYNDILRSLREFGRLPAKITQGKRFSFSDNILKNYDARYVTARLGYNVRMTDIAASLGVVQLKKLDQLNARRLKIVGQQQKLFSKYNKYFQTPEVRRNTMHSFYGYCILVKKNNKFTRKEFAWYLEKNGIETRSFFDGCLPDQPIFRKLPHKTIGQLPIARKLRDTALFIGCHPALNKNHVNHVRRVIDNFFKIKKA